MVAGAIRELNAAFDACGTVRCGCCFHCAGGWSGGYRLSCGGGGDLHGRRRGRNGKRMARMTIVRTTKTTRTMRMKMMMATTVGRWQGRNRGTRVAAEALACQPALRPSSALWRRWRCCLLKLAMPVLRSTVRLPAPLILPPVLLLLLA
jgi:hypothetical protein